MEINYYEITLSRLLPLGEITFKCSGEYLDINMGAALDLFQKHHTVNSEMMVKYIVRNKTEDETKEMEDFWNKHSTDNTKEATF